MPNGTMASDPEERLRIIVGGVLAFAGFVLVATALWLAISKYSASSDVVAVVGSVTGVVGTIVGAVFGVNVGSAGTSSANKARAYAEDKARTMALLVPPENADKAEAVLNS